VAAMTTAPTTATISPLLRELVVAATDSDFAIRFMVVVVEQKAPAQNSPNLSQYKLVLHKRNCYENK
jgi:hypothetical protein